MKRLSFMGAVALCALLFAGVAPAAAVAANGAPQAAGSCDGSEGVYLYDGKNYSGKCVRFPSDDADLSDQAFNNIASSVRIVGDWTATLFVDQNYGGSSSTFTHDDSDLSNNSIGDNRASAIRVQRGNVPSGNAC